MILELNQSIEEINIQHGAIEISAASFMHDMFNDGGDFADACIIAAGRYKMTQHQAAQAYFDEWGFIPDGYSVDHFKGR